MNESREPEMYEWQRFTLTSMEETALRLTDGHAPRGMISEMDRVIIRIAHAKLDINQLADECEAALAALPEPPHKVYLTCRATDKYRGFFDRHSNRDHLPEMSLDDHPEYMKYTDTCNSYSNATAILTALQRKLNRLQNPPEVKKRKKNGKGSMI